MNILALLTIFLGLIAICFFIALTEMIGRKVHKRSRTGALPPQDLQAAALDLVAEYELLERRNEWLESRQIHCKDVLAASMAQSRIPKRDKTRMEVAERMEAP